MSNLSFKNGSCFISACTYIAFSIPSFFLVNFKLPLDMSRLNKRDAFCNIADDAHPVPHPKSKTTLS